MNSEEIEEHAAAEARARTDVTLRATVRGRGRVVSGYRSG